jgi:hypothetical protein
VREKLASLVQFGIDWLLLILAAWMLLSGLVWAERGGRVISVVEATWHGAPAWMLFLPLFGLVAMVLLARDVPGAHAVLALGAFGYVLQGLAAFTWFQQQTGMRLWWGGELTVATGVVFGVLVGLRATREPSPLAGWAEQVYLLGRAEHLKHLSQLARAWGWRVQGPESPGYEVSAGGRWREREVSVQSSIINSVPGLFLLRVCVRSTRALWPMSIGWLMPASGPAERKNAARGACRTAYGGEAELYVWRPSNGYVRRYAVRELETVLEEGRRFLLPSTRISTTVDSVVYERRVLFRVSLDMEGLEQLLAWLALIAHTMEQGGLSSERAALPRS